MRCLLIVREWCSLITLPFAMVRLTQFQKAHLDLNATILHKTFVLCHLPFPSKLLCSHLPTLLLVSHGESVISFCFFGPEFSLPLGLCFLVISPSSSATRLWFPPLCRCHLSAWGMYLSFHFPTASALLCLSLELAQWDRTNRGLAYVWPNFLTNFSPCLKVQ